MLCHGQFCAYRTVTSVLTRGSALHTATASHSCLQLQRGSSYRDCGSREESLGEVSSGGIAAKQLLLYGFLDGLHNHVFMEEVDLHAQK